MITTTKKGGINNAVTSEELTELVRALEEDRSEKIRRLKLTLARLQRARLQVRNQKEILKRLRARIVELTPAGSN